MTTHAPILTSPSMRFHMRLLGEFMLELWTRLPIQAEAIKTLVYQKTIFSSGARAFHGPWSPCAGRPRCRAFLDRLAARKLKNPFMDQ